MNKLLILIITGGLLLFTNACSKYEAKYGVADFDEERKSLEQEIVYVDQYDIYLTDRTFFSEKRVTSTPNILKKKVVISYNHEKIAYLDTYNTPVIINNEGEVLETLSNYTGADYINWSADDQTLYILKDNQLFFHGEPMEVSVSNFAVNSPDTLDYKVEMAVVSKNGDVATFATYTKKYEQTRTRTVWNSQTQQYVYVQDTIVYLYPHWQVKVNYKNPLLNDTREEDDYTSSYSPTITNMKFIEGESSTKLYYMMHSPFRLRKIEPGRIRNFKYYGNPYPYFAGVNEEETHLLYVGTNGLILYQPDINYFFEKTINHSGSSFDQVNADWK